MNKDEAREAAWKRLKINEWRLKLRSTTQQKKAGELLNAMFDAGAASVDRRAIVEEAFEVLKHKMSNRPDVGELPRLAMAKEIDAVLAEMGGDDE